MKNRIILVVLLVVVLLASMVLVTGAAPEPMTDPSPRNAAPAGIYDFTTHGTGWVVEAPVQTVLGGKGWGAEVKARSAAGSYWVHIPVPFPTRIADSLMYVQYVQFCAASTNGASTKPVQVDLWDYGSKFYTESISWWADNAKHCWSHSFSTPVWAQDLGISVKLTFANTTDKIVLYKAWVRIAP